MNRRRFYGAMGFFVLASLSLWILNKVWRMGQEEEHYLVSVIVSDSSSERWITMKQGMEQAAKDCQINLNLVSTGPFLSLGEELAVIRREISNGADGVIVQMVSSEDVYEELEQILEKEAVVLLETDIEPKECFASIVPDNTGIGEALADSIIQDYGIELEGKRIGILGGNQKQIAMQQRLSGFTAHMEEKNAQILWVLDRSEADDIAEKEASDPVDILVALENAQTEWAVDYLQETQGTFKFCRLYGEGISEKAVYYLDRGVIASLVVPNEFHMGYLSVKEIHRQLSYPTTKGESSEVDFLVVDKENLYEAENQKILFPIVQ